MGFFVADPEVVRHGATLFRIVSVSSVPFTLFMVLNGAFQGGGDTRPVMFLRMLNLCGIRVPLAVFLTFSLSLGPVGIWCAVFVSNVSVALLGYVVLRRGRWISTLELEVSSLGAK